MSEHSNGPPNDTAANASTDRPDHRTPEADRTVDGDASDGAVSRRTLIRLLVGFGIGIPVFVELATFVGLVGESLTGGGGGGGGESGGSAGESTATPEPAVGVGDELLTETGPAETLTDATLLARSESFRLTLTVSVENSGEDPYVFQFGSVETENGRVVEGTESAVRVVSGESATVSGQWDLPSGSTPQRLTVRTTVGREETSEHTVRLAKIPVQNT